MPERGDIIRHYHFSAIDMGRLINICVYIVEQPTNKHEALLSTTLFYPAHRYKSRSAKTFLLLR